MSIIAIGSLLHLSPHPCVGIFPWEFLVPFVIDMRCVQRNSWGNFLTFELWTRCRSAL